jgi:lipopolysaccharide transport system permease protein
MSIIDGHGPLRDLWNHRALLGRMVKRDIRSRYQGSIFGTLWSFATPLLLLCAYWFFPGWCCRLASARPRRPHSGDSFSGLITHLFFAEVIGRSSGLIFEHATYVKGGVPADCTALDDTGNGGVPSLR